LLLMTQQPVIKVDSSHSGACALVAYLEGRTLYVANAGDCRAVLGTAAAADAMVETAVNLSTDHKCDLPSESERIAAAGGYVQPAVNEGSDMAPARLYQVQGKRWLGPGLCVSRALGDVDGTACGLVAIPEVVIHTVQPEDDLLILASDGVWEFITSEQAIKIVAELKGQGKSAEEACRMLIVHSALRWKINEGGYRDDITAIVVYLQDAVASVESEPLSV